MIYLLLALAAWRVSYMLIEQEGPLRIFDRIRQYGDLAQDFIIKDHRIFNFYCIECLSVWVALPFALFINTDLHWFVTWLIIAAGAILINDIHEKLAE